MIVLITGASRGVGLGLVQEYLNRGCRVIATCRNPDKAESLKAVLKDDNSIFPCDISTDESILNCFQQVKEATEKIDVLINNAGISNKNHPDEPPSSVQRKEFLEIMNTNAAGILSMTNTFIPLLKKSENGRVINIGSTMGSVQLNNNGEKTTSYKCSKAAVNMMTKSFALEFPDIMFYSIHPGWVQTDLGGSKQRTADISIEQSAKGIVDTAEKLGLKENGTFWSYDGTTLPY